MDYSAYDLSRADTWHRWRDQGIDIAQPLMYMGMSDVAAYTDSVRDQVRYWWLHMRMPRHRVLVGGKKYAGWDVEDIVAWWEHGDDSQVSRPGRVRWLMSGAEISKWAGIGYNYSTMLGDRTFVQPSVVVGLHPNRQRFLGYDPHLAWAWALARGYIASDALLPKRPDGDAYTADEHDAEDDGGDPASR